VQQQTLLGVLCAQCEMLRMKLRWLNLPTSARMREQLMRFKQTYMLQFLCATTSKRLCCFINPKQLSRLAVICLLQNYNTTYQPLESRLF